METWVSIGLYGVALLIFVVVVRLVVYAVEWALYWLGLYADEPELFG